MTFTMGILRDARTRTVANFSQFKLNGFYITAILSNITAKQLAIVLQPTSEVVSKFRMHAAQ